MNKKLSYLAALVFDTPLLIHRRKLDVILSVLAPKLEITSPLQFIDGVDAKEKRGGDPAAKPYTATPDGLAIIRVIGSTVRRSVGLDALSGLTSYSKIAAQFDAAVSDSACLGILLDIDSPGGEAGGVFDLSDKIYAARGIKPIYSIANESMFSAAYAIGSAADRVYVTRTGGVGSVGVVALHVDESVADKKDGLKYTYVYAGDKKTLGNSHAPLTKEAQSEIQGEVDRLYEMFVNSVARNRGIETVAVRATEAGCYFGPAALEAGFADEVGTFEVALNDLRSQLGLDASDVSEENEAEPAPDDLIDIDASLAVSSYSAEINALYPSSEIRHYVKGLGTAMLSGNPASGYKLSGCPIPYNKLSLDLGGFREIYQPGCFSESLQRDDIRVLFNHNPDFILGRTSAGTARYFDSPIGVQVETDMPNTDLVKDLVIEPMRRRDISGMSAGFIVERARWEIRDGGRVRVVEKARLLESSPAVFPAYIDTSVNIGGAQASQDDKTSTSLSEPIPATQPEPEPSVDIESILDVRRKRLQLIG